jgi:hypothetical protein
MQLTTLKVGETRSWGMVRQGGLHMGSFRTVAVFIGVLGLLFGVSGIVDAAHTKAHRQSSGDPGEMGRGPGKPEMILQGPVLDVKPPAGFIVMRHGAGKDAEELPISVDHKTTLTRGGKTISIDEVRVGDQVRVRFSGQPGEVSKMVDVLGGPSMRAGSRGASGTRRGSGM